MLVTVDTDYIDLVHNMEVLVAALDVLPAGWIVDLEFFKAGTFSFVKTSNSQVIPERDPFYIEDIPDFVTTIQGSNLLKKEAQSVSFREPLSSDVAKQQNQVLEEVLDTENGDTLLDGRFVKYGGFFLDTENNFAPVGLLAVANNIFLKEYRDDHDFIELFTKGRDKK